MKHFIVAGMPRSGTTFLYHNLQKHPDIFVPFRKEVNYFNVHFDRGEEWYRSLYKEAAPNQIWADISPPCFLQKGSEERIANFSPETKVILIIRDPLEWALSFYSQFQSFEYNLKPFSEFVNGHELKLGDKVLPMTFQNNFVPRRIQDFMDTFGERVLILPFRELKDSPLRMLKTFEAFLEISPYFNESNFDNRKINASGRKNIKFLSHLLSRESVISLIEKVAPRNMVLKARQKFDSISAAQKSEKLVEYTREELELSKELFTEQQQWVDGLFSTGNYILGNRTPMPLSQQSTSYTTIKSS